MTDTATMIGCIEEHGEETRAEFGVARLGIFDLASVAGLKPILKEHMLREVRYVA